MAEWADIQYNGESVGTLYTENDQIGYVPVITSAAAVPGYGILADAIKAAVIGGFTAEESYSGILSTLDNRSEFSYEDAAGESVEKPVKDITGLLEYSVNELPTPFTAYTTYEGVVQYLTQETGEDSLLRQDGEWVSFEGDAEDLEVWPVSEESVAIYDTLVNENKAPTINELELVPFE